jgi:inhibitor of KinA sporulation pathway (predicted exonuclease)
MYILVDIEATCWITPPRPRNKMPELIELAAIAFEEKEIISIFNIFVKPEINPILSQSCMELTKITQEQVDSGFAFTVAIELFEHWLSSFDSVKILSWGAFDRLQLLRELKVKPVNEEILFLIKNMMKSIDKLFQKKFSLTKGGLVNTLSHFGLDIQGQEHRATDDVKNTFNLVCHVYDQIKEELKTL